MPLPNYVAQTDVFFTWLDAFNNTLSHIDNTSVYLLVTQNDSPRTSTGNLSLNGTALVVAVNATGTITANLFSGNGASLLTLNASALASGTIPLARLTSANTTANGVIDTTTQRFAGNKTFEGDLTVTGNLVLLGQGTTINTNTVIVQDSMIQLAANNLISDALDIGLYGNYNPDGGAHEHTGLFRDASDDIWKLFEGLQDAPTDTINTSGTGYTTATLQAYLLSGALTTNSSALNVVANSSYNVTLTVNSVSATTFTGTLVGTANNATYLNGQPGSYYTNASNLDTGTLSLARLDANVILTTSTTGINASALSTGTVPLARLDANVILTTSSTGINASALSTGTVPLARLTSANSTANGVVDTTTQSFAGDKTFTGVLNATGGSKISVQNGVDGTSDRGIFLWTATDSNWGVYLSQAGAGKSLANGAAATGIDGRSGWHVRFRSGGLNSEGFLWENQSETALMHLASDTGNLYLKGDVYVGNSTNNLVLHTGSTTGINASALSTGTVPDARLSGSYSNITANNANNLNGQPASYYTNASNLTTGTLPLARLDANVILTTSTTGINASALSTGTVPDARLSGDYTGITSLSLGANVVANVTTFFVGNSTANVSHTATQLSVANTTNTATLTSISLTIGNTVANTTTVSATNLAGNGASVTSVNAVALNGKTEANLNVNNATQATNATNLNSQPGSFYTNASNLDSGTVPLARLDANVILTTSTTGINASALSTGTVPAERLPSASTTANGAVDTTTQSFAGNKTFQNTVSFSNTVSMTGAANALSTLGVGDTLSALGQLSVTGNATFDTNTLFVDATNNRLGMGITSLQSFKPEGVGVDFIPSVQLEGVDDTLTRLSILRNSSSATGPQLILAKSRGTATGSFNAVKANDSLGVMYFMGTEGFGIYPSVKIEAEAEVDATSLQAPQGRLKFATTNASGSMVERVCITGNGNMGIGNTTPAHLLSVEGIARILGAVTLSNTVSVTGTLTISSGLNANGNVGTSGQVLTSNGAGAYWATSTSSTIDPIVAAIALG